MSDDLRLLLENVRQAAARYQFVSWFPHWVGFHHEEFVGGISTVYLWSQGLGFWELRRWTQPGEVVEWRLGNGDGCPECERLTHE